ncbi:MAG TPA: sulfate reduction electron transfer complex DsrMKJOP subunit DsrJ [Candidatus Acidoferrum sp.]|nr:sulfate reduction electron transfer complex DsrMKJOP subunit DsrJ [Candidatus Methylomirabilis sp.]HWU40552.1 sulfate reduction electron transfer complex DsrMKJOP subunit DsrJ [Candidatus Acidoferrum sp.]
MRDKGIILGGLIVFLGVITFPVWYNVAAGTTSKAPELKLPKEEKNCVAAVEYMRTSHMDLLTGWRDEVVRQDLRTFTAFDGKTYTKSLTQTCLKCHASKADFCDRCHDYAGVKPYCWDCHVDPKDPRVVQRSTT